MGIFEKLSSVIERKATDVSALTWGELFPQTSAKAGVSVNVMTALRTSTVFACCRVLAEGVAQLPVNLFNIDGNTKTKNTTHPAYKILAQAPNEWMSSFEFRETMMFHAVLTGNAYAYIGRGQGTIVELIPLVPNQVSVMRHPDYSIEYIVTDLGGNTTRLSQEDVLHIRGPSWDTYLGLDAVQMAREAIGLAIATEETHASLHANGAQPGGVLSVKGKLDKDARERLKTAWQAFQGGVANRFKTAVLDVDAEWKPLSMSGVDSQHLETRRFQIEEICRSMRVFPQLVMHADKTSTFASAEAFFLAHVTHSLMPWIIRWEQAINRTVLGDDDKLVCKLNVSSLLRGDATTRASFYQSALGGARGETAYMTRNEVRELEDLNPIEGGDELPMPTAPVAPTAIGGPPDDGAQTKSELLQFLLAHKFNPDQPRDDGGRFASGGGGGSGGGAPNGSGGAATWPKIGDGSGLTKPNIARVARSVGVDAVVGALRGAATGAAGGALRGGIQGAAIGAAVGLFVELGGAEVVGSTLVSMFGPSVLPSWAMGVLQRHEATRQAQESPQKSIDFGALTDDELKLVVRQLLPQLSEDQMIALAQSIVSDVDNDEEKANPNHDSAGRFASGSGGGGGHVGEFRAANIDAPRGLMGSGVVTSGQVTREWAHKSPINNVEKLYAKAEHNKLLLDAAGAAIQSKTGAKMKTADLKKVERVLEKLKDDRPVGEISDVVRSTFIVKTPAQADAVVKELAKTFPIVDEGYRTTDAGYSDRTVKVRFENNQMGEVLIMPPEMLHAKGEGGGHDLYKTERSLPKGSPERQAVREQSKKLYADAKSQLGPAWKAVLGN